MLCPGMQRGVTGGMAASTSESWFETPLARATLACERLLAGRLTERLFGGRLLQLGHWSEMSALLEHCRVNRRLVVDAAAPADIVADLAALPVASGSIDVVVMPHTLEFAANPHASLREADRVLAHGGHIFMLGFSRYSLWGFRELLRRPPYGNGARLLAEHRIGDWMQLLGFELLAMERYFYRLPINQPWLIRRSRWLEQWGRSRLPGPWPAAAWAAVFRKQPPGATPISPHWYGRRPVIRPGTVPGGLSHNRKRS